eukprot:TRINITY_DN318_c0_g3_i7.p1 TRINITY_DN318_c0_g3~~TRINITY_DN318_c0_g3_i7.p1  ORF type:complete len:479 (-),score=89.18 TRINITY_DN318_c0_g3_i7:3064-4500(-)
MNRLYFVAVFAAFTVLNTVIKIAEGAPICECVDWAPKGSRNSCYDMMMWGQCNEHWMKGRCECTCGKCKEIWIGDCMCNETPPPDSPVSCEEQKNQGKCNEYWMQGYCECSCGKCDGEHEFEKEFDDSSSDIFEELKKITVPEEKANRLSRKEIPDKNSDSNGNLKFTILHFNDFHARVTPATEWWWPCENWRNDKGECYGGLARMKTVVDRERAKGLPVLVLDAGDDMIGTDWNHHYWALEPATDMFNDIGLDALVLGNHDFDHGSDTTATYLERLNYPAVSCNMEANGHYRMKNLVKKYIIKEINGRKVGIFGLTTTYTNWAEAANPGPVYFKDESSAAINCIDELKNQGVDIIIALTHHGYNADKYLARQISDIDIVIGGHSHAVLTGNNPPKLASGATDSSWGSYPSWEGSWVQPGRTIPVVQVGWASRYVGRMTVEFDKDGNLVSFDGEPILLDKNIPEDANMKGFAQSKMHW